jgi:hypothetical protein
MSTDASRELLEQSAGASDWSKALRADKGLSPGLRESYRRTLEGFELFCQKRAQTEGGAGKTGGRRTRIALAREYVEQQRLERVPGPAQLQEWKQALNWLFRQGKPPASPAMRDVAPLGRADLGRCGWEQRLVLGVQSPLDR